MSAKPTKRSAESNKTAQSGTETSTKARPSRRKAATAKLQRVPPDAGDAADAGIQHIRDNPFIAVAGAVAVTAGLALLLPASRRETELMGGVASSIGEAARGAAEDAIDAGRAQVKALADSALGGVGGVVMEAVLGADADGKGADEGGHQVDV